MGDTPLQPQTLICRSETPVFYELELEDAGLRYLDFEDDLDWALFVAYNRGETSKYAGTPLEAKTQAATRGIDLVRGRIANDRVFFAVQRFYDGLMTVETLSVVLKALNYGGQVVAISPHACAAIKILSERTLAKIECDNLRRKSDVQRERAEELTTKIMRERRHMDGRYFDEVCDILAAGKELT